MEKNATKRFLVIYCIAIFIFAVAIILIASLSQARINREADAIAEKLNSAETLAADKQTRLDAVMTENARLTNENKTLSDSNEKLTEQKKTDDKRIAAYQKLALMINYKRMGDKAALQKAISDFEKGGYAECLNVSDREIYNSIR